MTPALLARTRTQRIVTAATLLVALFAVGAVGALSPSDRPAPLSLEGTGPVRALGPASLSWIDPSANADLADARKALADGAFAPVGQPHLNLGYTVDPAWLVFRTHNPTPRALYTRLSTTIPYVPALDVWTVGESGAPELILSKDRTTPYDDVVYYGFAVVSPEVTLKSGETLTYFIRFQPYGIGILPLSLETETSLQQQRLVQAIKLSVFYTFALGTLAAFIIFLMSMPNTGAPYFAALFLTALILLAQIDGLWHAFLWPGAPAWNLIASLPMLLIFCAVSFKATAFMLRTLVRPWITRALGAMAWLSLSPLFLTPFVAVVWLIPAGSILLVLALGGIVFATGTWAASLPYRQAVTVIASGVIAAAIAGATLFTFAGSTDFSAHTHDLVKALYVFIAATMMGAYATHIWRLNDAFAKGAARELELARQEAERAGELLEAERRFARARDLAQRNMERLASASHDLKQPLASLRLSLDAIGARSGAGGRQSIVRAFDYLERLIEDNLEEGRRDADGDALINDCGDDRATGDGPDRVDFALILEATRQMFEEEAVSKGLSFRVVESSLVATAPLLPMMRIVTNLASNAIKHTRRGGVLIGYRRTPTTVFVDIIDQGPGMSADAIAHYRKRGVKGEASAGDGLGLAIYFELTETHAIPLDVRSIVGRGTQFRIALPRVRSDHPGEERV
ncbi:MAG: 7TM-DISM domain-containing protein [Devosia sp.]